MSPFSRSIQRALIWVVFCAARWNLAAESASAAELLMKDGRILKGKLAPVASLADVPKAPNPNGTGPMRLILLLDDDLRRTFVSKRRCQEIRPDNPGQVEEKFTVRQRVAKGGQSVKSVGPVLKIKPFDGFGRRIFRFNAPGRAVDVIQGITLITPTWTKVEGISHVWDMRIATSSIPRDVLHKILLKQIDAKNIEHRKKVARFYLQSERYADARKELEAVLKAFPNQPKLKEQLAPSIRMIRQLGAQRLLQELKLRRAAGQHRLALGKLKTFPAEGVAGAKLQEVRELIEEYKKLEVRGAEFFKQFDALLEKVKDTTVREQIKPIRREIGEQLNVNTLGRMTAFLQNADDRVLLPEEKLSLAVSGWLLGSDAAGENLSVSLSLYKVRDLVRKYLNEPVKLERARILGALRSQEGAAPPLVAGLIAHMKPPVQPPSPVVENIPGLYKLEIGVLSKEPPVSCLVQLPPEYDPYRSYPAIVTLHGAGTTAVQQIDWWAGALTKEGWRSGQATRQGYIVIAPEWTSEHQKQYGYSAREHAAVLNSLRSACRRFSIDTDRVFLTGHSMGGDAAWDIGLAHPDLWAGVIPIVAKSDRYVVRYWKNARYVPLYFVCGERDGTKMTNNAPDFDRYLRNSGFDATVVEYLGRGHEHFYEEILRIFDWMGRRRRDFFPRRKVLCQTMRPWDNYFWWVELDGLPPGSMVDPADWPPPRGTQAVEVETEITKNNGIYVVPRANHVRVWVSPEMVDFKRRVRIVVGGRRINNRNPFVQPDLQTLLEDVRTRGDRKHPFWAKYQWP